MSKFSFIKRRNDGGVSETEKKRSDAEELRRHNFATEFLSTNVNGITYEEKRKNDTNTLTYKRFDNIVKNYNEHDVLGANNPYWRGDLSLSISNKPELISKMVNSPIDTKKR